MTDRISSVDVGYQSGDLSLYPEAKDDVSQLYRVENNAVTTLKQSLTYNGKYVIVEDSDAFPSDGVLRIGPPPGEPGDAELIYYAQKTRGVFRNLVRGFAGSRRNPWPAGSHVTNSVFSDAHNSVKDAILKIERNIGVEEFPAEGTLNYILKEQETRFLSPKALFQAYPLKGAPPLQVRFQSFTTGDPVRFLWDFGDGTNSVERHPIHTYRTEGHYTVKLNIITSLGAQAVATKLNYIEVDEEAKQPFFYVTPATGYSIETAAARTAAGNPTDATVFSFVDQTDGDITQRYWIFDGAGESDDGEVGTNNSIAVLDPNIHAMTYTYSEPGEYAPSVIVLTSDQRLKRAFLKDKIVVL